uniref:Rhodanese domain-containing protein n=1 Tax=Alexandrium monilatum TaxID=311494 RepID=A0A7S4PUN8_9DINO
MSGASSSTAPGARKTRILAVHGGASNANIMKFQTGPLRKILGSEAEWFFPESAEPWQSAAESIDPDLRRFVEVDPALAFYYAERSPFEVRLAQNKPFVQWFKIVSDGTGPIAEPVTFERSIAWLTDYIAREGPFDVVVNFAQGSIVCNTVLSRLMQSGKGAPWKLSIAFSPTPTPILQRKDHVAPFPQVAFIIASPPDPLYLNVISYERTLYANVEVLEHQDGVSFPVTPPVSRQIYERLASEIRRHCGLVAPAGVTVQEKRRDWAARLAKYRSAGQASPTAGAGTERVAGAGAAGSIPGVIAPRVRERDAPKDEDPEPEEEKPVEVPEVTAQALAEMLRAKTCVVADIANRRRGLPGLEKDDISSVTLRMVPGRARAALTRLKEDGRHLVAASVAGEECQEYCERLVKQFGFQADRLCVLAGGLRSWDVWELENPEAGNELRRAYGLPDLRGTVVGSVGVEALAELLLLRSCIAVDVREPEETRRRAFPGAQKDVSLLMLRKRPHLVKRKLAALREDGRPLVAVSGTGLRCRRYCSLLVDDFGFDADKVCWLEGGLLRWEEWELENREAGDEIRRVHDLPSIREHAPEEGRAARLREHSLDVLT